MVSTIRLESFEYVDEPSDLKAQQTYFETIEHLSNLPYWFPAQGDGNPIVLKFSERAQAKFKDWYTTLTIRLEFGEMSSLMRSHLGKYSSLMPSLALLIHLVEMAHGEKSLLVSLSAINKAILLCNYLEDHADQIIHRNELEIEKKVEALKSEYLNNEYPEGFTLRNFKRRKSLRDDTDNTANWLSALDELGALGWHKKTTKGNSKIYQVNPRIFD
jgi:hypothetical protein